jgi:hypothetical protein
MTQEQFKEILESIGEDLYNKVVINRTNPWEHILNLEDVAVSGAFIWKKSPEGHDFWDDVHHKFVEKYKQYFFSVLIFDKDYYEN